MFPIKRRSSSIVLSHAGFTASRVSVKLLSEPCRVRSQTRSTTRAVSEFESSQSRAKKSWRAFERSGPDKCKKRRVSFGGRKEMYKRAVLMLVLFAIFTGLVMGQTAGTISGVVQDPTGAVIPGVSVTVKNVDTGITRMLLTDEQGR